MKEKKIKRNMNDAVFNDLFSRPERLLELYKILIGDELNPKIRAEDIRIIDSDKVFINDLYNDLSFMVDKELMILVEAQSTYTKNIVTRILFYLARSLEEYMRKMKTRDNFYDLYYEKVVEIPKIKLYTVYTGSRKMDDHYVHLSELMSQNSIKSDLDVRVKIICNRDENNILGQYMVFCDTYKNEFKRIKKVEGKEEAIRNAIEICIKKGILKEYLQVRKSEVIKMLAHSITSEDWIEYEKKKSRKEGIEIGEKRGISIGEIKGMLLLGANHKKIIELTGVSEEDILDVEKSMK